jgi:hypothetical protein
MSVSPEQLEQWRLMIDAHLLRPAERYASGQFPKECRSCGERHEEGAWRRLPLLRLAIGEETIELRNCDCAATLAVALEEEK